MWKMDLSSNFRQLKVDTNAYHFYLIDTELIKLYITLVSQSLSMSKQSMCWSSSVWNWRIMKQILNGNMNNFAHALLGTTSHLFGTLNWRSPFSLLLAKSVGPNNFWLRQFKIVGVGATIGSYPNSDIFIISGAKNCWPNHFVPTIGEKVYC